MTNIRLGMWIVLMNASFWCLGLSIMHKNYLGALLVALVLLVCVIFTRWARVPPDYAQGNVQ